MRPFTGWVRIIGGILKYAGVTGFLANLDELVAQADQDASEWEVFLVCWYERFGEAWKTTAEVSDALPHERSNQDAPLFAGGKNENEPHSLFDALLEWLLVAFKEKPKSFKVSLGKALEKRADACFGEENWHLEKTLEKHSKKPMWRVLRGVAGGGFSLIEGASSAVNQSIKNQQTVEGDGRINPPQPPANGQDLQGQNAGSGLTGGLTQSCVKEKAQKTADSAIYPPQISADKEERETFTL